MINTVYRLVAPRMIDVTYTQIDPAEQKVILRPEYLSLCKADQRYYQGTRSQAVLRSKLPMALVHECVGRVVLDPTGTFAPGERVVPIPNVPGEDDGVTAENYRLTSSFLSSGHDGFFRDLVQMPPDRMVRVPQGIKDEIAAFTELVSVAVHSISRFERLSHSRRQRLGVWGNGNLGYIMSLLLSVIFPDAEIYVFGTVEEKLGYFTFATKTFHVDAVEEAPMLDHTFECVGGTGARSAINQMIDLILPEGTISLMGVSENFPDINTRMILEKGLQLYGSSRSGYDDFDRTMKLFSEHPRLLSYLENLVGDVVTVHTIDDIHRAFNIDFNRGFGKVILKWEK